MGQEQQRGGPIWQKGEGRREKGEKEERGEARILEGTYREMGRKRSEPAGILQQAGVKAEEFHILEEQARQS